MRLSFADGLFWSSVACCAIAQLFILRSVSGGGAGRPASDPGGPGVPQPRGVLEMFWAVVPAIALVALLVVTWRAMHDRTEPVPAPTSAPVMEAER